MPSTKPLRPLPVVNDQIAAEPTEAIATEPADGRECIDPGAGPSRTLVGVFNPTSQKQALAQALGLNALERSNALKGYFLVNIPAAPQVLKLDVKKKFTIKNFGKDLDGSWTVEEILLMVGDIPEMKLWVIKEDGGAPPPQIFGTDAAAFFPVPPPPAPAMPDEINPPAIAPEAPPPLDPALLAPEFHQLPDLAISDADASGFKLEGATQAGNFVLTDWSAGSFGNGQTLWDAEKKEAIASYKNKIPAIELPQELSKLVGI